MGLVPRPAPQLPCSERPATSDQFRNELTACLALVVPVGMTEESRREWLTVAWGTLKHLPPDALLVGCKAARETCDHPSKIVPAILKATEQMMSWKRDAPSSSAYVALPAPRVRPVMDRRGEAMSDDDTAELNTLLEKLGATARYRADGSRYSVAV